MPSFRRIFAILAIAGTCYAQTSEVSIESPPPPRYVGPILKPFHLERRVVPQARLTNSPRLESLVRGGNLYLTAQDVIALVLENNLDIAVQRYSPFLAREVLRRTQGGGYLRQVDTPVLAGPVSVSLAGVSVNANGLAGGGGVSAGGGIVSQIGPIPPNLDPSIYINGQLGHLTTPESNTLLNQTTALTNDYRQFVAQYSQQFVTGTSAQFTFSEFQSKLNSPTPVLNPAISGSVDLQINQNLLQGLSIGVNNRDIRVAKNNMKVSNLQVKRQVITTVAAVLNLYWDLVSFNEDVRIKEQALATAEKLLDDNKKAVEIGTLSPIEVTRAAAEASSSKEDLLIAQTNVQQQEMVLKNAISRNGSENAWLDEVHIIPLDKIEVPASEDIKAMPELLQEALTNRSEIEQDKVNIDSQKILLKGDRNGLLPSLQAFAELTNHGLAGPLNPIYNGSSGPPDAYFLGGTGTALAQAFRRNFPDYSAGFSLTIPFRNRAQQADYVTDQLLLRQAELQLQRAINQVRLDVKNAVIGLQQARTRYQTAVGTRVLAEQSLKAEQSRYLYGVSTVALVIQAQKDLAQYQSAEVQATANYTHARIAFDQAVGRTLEENHVSFDEAVSGKVARQSFIPDSALEKKQPGVIK
jgi:outer membrane protein TolC